MAQNRTATGQTSEVRSVMGRTSPHVAMTTSPTSGSAEEVSKLQLLRERGCLKKRVCNSAIATKKIPTSVGLRGGINFGGPTYFADHTPPYKFNRTVGRNPRGRFARPTCRRSPELCLLPAIGLMACITASSTVDGATGVCIFPPQNSSEKFQHKMQGLHPRRSRRTRQIRRPWMQFALQHSNEDLRQICY